MGNQLESNICFEYYDISHNETITWLLHSALHNKGAGRLGTRQWAHKYCGHLNVKLDEIIAVCGFDK